MSEPPRWSRDQVVTLATLTVGYAGYYLCRSDLSLVAPLLPDRDWVGRTAAIGIVAYALGKAGTGWIADRIGSRATFLFGAWISALVTVGCAQLGREHPPVLLWCINLLAQSAGWAAAVRMLGEWFVPAQYGRAISVLSLSYLFGDALVRWALGALMTPTTAWQTVFTTAGVALAATTAVAFGLLGESTLPQPAPHPATPEVAPPPRAWILQPAFWCAAGCAFGLTLIRETLTFWAPALLRELGGMDTRQAAQWSALFPLLGGVSVLLIGLVGARLATPTRNRVLIAMLAGATVVLALLSFGVAPGQTRLLQWALGAVAVLLIAPYAILLGLFPLELGTVRRSGSLAGILDAIGYSGAVASGAWIGGLATRAGWPAALQVLTVAAAVSTLAVVGYGAARRPPVR